MEADIRWLDDPEIFRVREMPAHSDHEVFRSRAEAETGRSSLVRSLSSAAGIRWNFCFSRNPGERPADFFREGWEPSADSPWHFREIRVPCHIGLAGYDSIQYVNSLYPWEGKIFRRPAGCGLPGDRPEGMFSAAADNSVGSYLCFFDLDEAWMRERVSLVLEGAERAVYVWINGHFAGYAEDSFTPSEFDLTPWIRREKNRLAIEVYKHCTASFLEDQDFFRFFGLFRDVKLCARPKLHIEDIDARPEVIPGADGLSGGRLSLFLRTGEGEGKIRVSVYDGGVCLAEEERGFARAEEPWRMTFSRPVRLWTHGDPHLYLLEIETFDPAGAPVEDARTAIGFRTLEIRDGVIRLNGEKLMLLGVNRHEWSAENGRVISRAEMNWDIGFMKRHHINAVRTCHYPNRLEWYRLCDENGIYVMAEANLESHGSWQQPGGISGVWNVPGSFPNWEAAAVDRVRTQYETLKNHPSILFWSLGNESYVGENLARMQEFLRDQGDGRLIHYEGVCHDRSYEDRVSDVESRMYASPENAADYLSHNPKKPYLLCEFMHDMGNSLGGMESYMKLFDRFPGYHGGFVWDYIDQALFMADPATGERRLCYGGDFDDRPTDYEFSGDGLLFADRTEKPAAAELKYWYGKYSGEESFAPPEPEEEETLPSGEKPARLRLVYGDETLGIRGENFQILFSYLAGGPVSLVSGGMEWLYRAPVPAFWRAMTDNDRGCGLPVRSAMWLGADQFRQVKEVRLAVDGTEVPLPAAPANNGFRGDETAEEIVFTVVFETATVPQTEVRVRYRVCGSRMRVEARYLGRGGLPELPVFGLRWIMPTAAKGYRYRGLSGETYPDRMRGGVPGIYEGKGLPVTPYLVPQDCGMHMETRWLEIRRDTSLDNRGGAGEAALRFTQTEVPFAFSCLPYTAAELESALHQEELPKPRRTVLTVCGAVRGVGGIQSWGAEPEEAYRIDAAKDICFSFEVEMGL